MGYQTENTAYGKLFVAIIAFVAALVAFLRPDWIGLILVFVVASVLFVIYFVRQYLTNGYWRNKASTIFKGLIQQDFLEWQQNVLEVLYEDLEIVSVFGKRYPAAILRTERILEYPFKGLCKLRRYDLPQIKSNLKQKMYIKILGNTLHAPRMKGYALSKIYYNADGQTQSFDAVTTNQQQNIMTCHILEWELFELFKTHRGKPPGSQTEILKNLPFRERFHDGRSGIAAISEPHNAYPLISVQAIVIYLDKKHDPPTWRVVLAKRSDNVVVKPGFFQFQPAGGFEVFGSQADDETFLVKQGFDVGNALLREYAEELFNVEEFQENLDGRDPNSIRANPFVNQLTEAVNKHTAWIEFLGTIVDLTILRPEFSFLILVEDDFFCNSVLRGCWEAKKINSPRVDELGDILADGTLHGSSAGLLQLAIENPRVKNLGLDKMLLGE